MSPARIRPIALWHCGALLALLAGCPGTQDKPTSHSSSASASASTPSATTATAKLPAPLAPGSRAAIRENAALGVATDGASLEIRALRSRVLAKDGLGIALRLVPLAGAAPSGWNQAQIDWTKVRASLRFEVKTPAGATRTLQVAEALGTANPWPLELFVQTLTIDGEGLTQGKVRQAWKEPAVGLFDAAGDYEVSVSGSFSLGGKDVVLRAGPLKLSVVAEDQTQRPLVDLEQAAAEVARNTWGAKGTPLPANPTIDDVDGNLSVRFRQSGAQPGGTGYDDDILEVWLDPAGQTLAVDAYRHFTCVAEGTLIATPRGPTPIEALTVGTEVIAFDVDTGLRSVATVLATQRSHSESLWQFGALRVTGEHPVWANGAWTRAAAIPEGATLLGADGQAWLATPSTLELPGPVYDLTVSPPHTYFAGGFLVHNKAQHVPLGGERPWGPLFFRHAAKP